MAIDLKAMVKQGKETAKTNMDYYKLFVNHSGLKVNLNGKKCEQMSLSIPKEFVDVAANVTEASVKDVLAKLQANVEKAFVGYEVNLYDPADVKENEKIGLDAI